MNNVFVYIHTDRGYGNRHKKSEGIPLNLIWIYKPVGREWGSKHGVGSEGASRYGGREGASRYGGMEGGSMHGVGKGQVGMGR